MPAQFADRKIVLLEVKMNEKIKIFPRDNSFFRELLR